MLSTFNDHRRARFAYCGSSVDPEPAGYQPGLRLHRRASAPRRSARGSTARARPATASRRVRSAVRIQSPRRYQYRYSSDASRLDRQSRRPIRGIAPASGLFLSVFPVRPQPHRPCEAMRQRFKRTALTAIAHQGCRSLEINLGGSLRWDEARNHSRCGVQAGPTSRSSNPC